MVAPSSLLLSFIAVLACSLYQISECGPVLSCPVSYVKRGCYHDSINNRRLPQLLVYGRGELEEGWGNWNLFIPAFICKCAEEAMKKNYRYFGIQYYAECWSGNATADSYAALGSYGNGCASVELSANCNDADPTLCVGRDLANYVYEIQIPTTQPPAIDCRDKLVECEKYATNGLCTDKYPSVLEYCPQSCGRCT